MVETKASALTSWHNADAYFSLGNCFHPNLIELGFHRFNLGSVDNILRNLKLDLFLALGIVFVMEIHFFVELCNLLDIHFFELGEETLLERGILDSVVVFN